MSTLRPIPVVFFLLSGCGYPWDILYDSAGGQDGDSPASADTAPPTTGDAAPDVSATDFTTTGFTTTDLTTTDFTTTDFTTTDFTTTDFTTTTGASADMCVAPDPGCPDLSAEDCATDEVDENCDGTFICDGTAKVGRDFVGVDGVIDVAIDPTGDVLLLASSSESVELGGGCGSVTGYFAVRFDRTTLDCEAVSSWQFEDGFEPKAIAAKEQCAVVVVGTSQDSAAVKLLSSDLQLIEGVFLMEATDIYDIVIEDGISVMGSCDGGLWVAVLDDSLTVLADDCVLGSLTGESIARRDEMIAITGSYSGDVMFGGQELLARHSDDPPGNDAFVAVLQTDGDLVWQAVAGMGGLNSDVGNGVAISASGDVFVTGYTHGPSIFLFGSQDLLDCDPTCGTYDAFVSKLDPNLGHLETLRYGTNNNQLGGALELDGAGNLLISGRFATNIQIGSETMFSEPPDSEAVYHAKLDPNSLEAVWKLEVDGATDDNLAVDLFGSVVVSQGIDNLYIRTFRP